MTGFIELAQLVASQATELDRRLKVKHQELEDVNAQLMTAKGELAQIKNQLTTLRAALR
jgi:hypothetical protein